MNTATADSVPHTSEATMSGTAASTGTESNTGADSATPTGTQRAIEDMRDEIDTIDTELVRLIQRRTEISKAIGAARAGQGGTRIVYSREMKVLDRFAALGPSGTDLGMLLLALGRGKLGRR